MRTLRLLVAAAVLIAAALSSAAQDYHFSQFYAVPTCTNPSLTGAFDGVFRASVIGRTQWLAVAKPFLTIAATADGAVYKNSRRQELLAIGLAFCGDKAGDLGYSSSQALLSVSYIRNFGRRSRHKIGIGLCGGIVNNSLNLANSTWDSQFAGGLFNPNLPSGENLTTTSRLYADFGAGAFWSFLPADNVMLRAALGASHINRPFVSMSESPVRLPVRYSIDLYSQIGLTPEVALSPMFHASFQRRFSEYVLGCNAEYFKKKNSYTTLYTLGGGVLYRWNDAIVINAFFSCGDVKLSVAYDINVSPFVAATHGRGGLEVAISYVFKRKTITRVGKEPCPYDIM